MQPNTGQQHKLRKMRIRQLGLLVLGLVTAAVVAECALFLANLHTRHRAESLLVSLRSLRLELSTFEDTKALLDGYKAKEVPVGSGCASAGAAYGILVSNHTIDYLGANHPFLLKLGVKPVSATAVLSFSGNHLCEFRYSASALIAGEQYPTKDRILSSMELLELNAETAVQEFDSSPGLLNEHYGIYYFDTLLRGSRWPGRILGMHVTVTPSTPPNEFQDALSFDLSCFGSLSGCRALCQFMPAASRAALQKHKTAQVSPKTR